MCCPCPLRVPVLGKLLAHLKARLASTTWPRKVAADGSQFPAEGHHPGSTEPPQVTKTGDMEGKPSPGIQGEELPPSL